MFRETRKKIILSIMCSIILLFAVTLAVIILVNYREVRQRSTDMLVRYVDLFSLDRQLEMTDAPVFKPEEQIPAGPRPDQKDLSPDIKPEYQLSTFYSVAFSEDGTVLCVDNVDGGLYDEEELIAIARELLAENDSSGRHGSLSFQVSRKPDCILVAFIDDTVSQNSMRMLLHNVLIVGGSAIAVLFLFSLFLSKRIIRPLEENDKLQRQFISDASHELKTPVAVIAANAEMLSRETGENEWLANIQYENERMGDLVKQLLDLSRAENKEMALETLDFSRVVTGETLAFDSVAFEQGKSIQCDIEDGICVSGSQAQLTQMVSVLLDNAIQHGTGNGIEVELKHQKHGAVFSVTNAGEEIAPEKLEHLFDRFYRIDEARNSESHHYGLGLSIAKAVAEKHGGTIEASCHGGKVQFAVFLPVSKKA